MKLFISWYSLILLLMVIPIPGDSQHWLAGLDLVIHFGLFGILGGTSKYLFNKNSSTPNIVGYLSTVSLLTIMPEILQIIIPGRGFAWLDLMTNLSAFSWGCLAGIFLPGLSYLYFSAGILGMNFLLGIFDQLSYSLLLEPDGTWTLWLAFFIPLLPMIFTAWKRRGRTLCWMTLLFLVFMMGVKKENPGMAIFLGGIGLSLFLFAQTEIMRFTGRSIRSVTELVGLTGYCLFMIKCISGTGVFISQAGLIMVTCFLLGGMLQLVFLGYIDFIQLNSKFSTANDSR